MRANKQLINGEYVVPNLKCYWNLISSLGYLISSLGNLISSFTKVDIKFGKFDIKILNFDISTGLDISFHKFDIKLNYVNSRDINTFPKLQADFFAFEATIKVQKHWQSALLCPWNLISNFKIQNLDIKCRPTVNSGLDTLGASLSGTCRSSVHTGVSRYDHGGRRALSALQHSNAPVILKVVPSQSSRPDSE